ncbi:hypothetical protein PT974_09590 [Cladobotryum mycophilum]|uniref:Uncharacterized protein n=1 Tax=Cladobotryum mycophilum TaxID=491253 RepID=A0ABR0SH39_9HYPO
MRRIQREKRLVALEERERQAREADKARERGGDRSFVCQRVTQTGWALGLGESNGSWEARSLERS